MAWKECVTAITAAVGRPLSDDEIEGIAEAVQMRLTKKLRDGLTPRDAASQVGKEISGEMALKAMLQRRDAMNNIRIKAELTARTIVGKEDKVSKSIISGYAGSNELNMANSVDAAHITLRDTMLAPAVLKLEKAGVMKLIDGKDAAFDRDLARELRRRKDPTLEADTGNSRAKVAAQVLGEVMDAGRALQNKAGAFIGEIDGYMGRQYHDMWKVRGDGSEAAFKSWRDAITPLLDTDRMFADLTPENATSSLRETWRALSSGLHDTASDPALAGFQGGANLGKKVSQDRSIIFKDADSWVNYNEKFGKGSVKDAIFAGADGAARDAALMQKFGTNPKMMWDWWQDSMMRDAYDRGDFKMGDKLKARTNDAVFDLVAGKGNIPANATIATIGATVRNSMQLIHLGSILFSALTHIPINAELMRHNGSNFWEGLGNQMRALLPPTKEGRELALSLHAGIDGMMGHIIHRFRTEDGVPGKMAEAVNVFHKYNGFGYFMDGQKMGLGLGISHSLAQKAGQEFEALDMRMQMTMRRYGIEKADWDVGRASQQKAADGRNYLLPAHIGDEAVQQKFQTMITDQIREGLNEPTPHARHVLTANTKAGTVFGELVRGLTQFKSFSLTILERQMGRMTRNGFDLPGSLYLVGGMTMAGYVGMTLRDFASNRSPRQPEDAGQWAKLLADSMVAGGGAGLYGDVFLRFGERGVGDMVKSLIGPAPATAADAVFGAKHVVEAGMHEKGGVAAKELQKVLGDLTPNHVAFKAANDYLIGHMFREMVSPGATERYNQMLKDKGQHQILRPPLQK